MKPEGEYLILIPRGMLSTGVCASNSFVFPTVGWPADEYPTLISRASHLTHHVHGNDPVAVRHLALVDHLDAAPHDVVHPDDPVSDLHLPLRVRDIPIVHEAPLPVEDTLHKQGLLVAEIHLDTDDEVVALGTIQLDGELVSPVNRLPHSLVATVHLVAHGLLALLDEPAAKPRVGLQP